MSPRARDVGITIGTLPTGTRNSITDVAGVLVGHCSVVDPAVGAFTGVTAVLPHPGNVFIERVPAAAYVRNGFCKPGGLVQIEELGLVESPIILTNTLSVGTALVAVARHAIASNPIIGREGPTVNGVVLECNDGYLNDIQAFHVTETHVIQSITSASVNVDEGGVGAGTGMSCFELKGGIGSSSRVLPELAGTVGCLVLCNFGQLSDLTLSGRRVGRAVMDAMRGASVDQGSPKTHQGDRGSAVVVVATDLPLSDRQLRRLAVRADAGLARTGTITGHGSGDLVVALSTATTVRRGEAPQLPRAMVTDEVLDEPFRAVAEATEESVLNALLTSTALRGFRNHERRSLAEFLDAVRC